MQREFLGYKLEVRTHFTRSGRKSIVETIENVSVIMDGKRSRDKKFVVVLPSRTDLIKEQGT